MVTKRKSLNRIVGSEHLFNNRKWRFITKEHELIPTWTRPARIKKIKSFKSRFTTLSKTVPFSQYNRFYIYQSFTNAEQSLNTSSTTTFIPIIICTFESPGLIRFDSLQPPMFIFKKCRLYRIGFWSMLKILNLKLIERNLIHLSQKFNKEKDGILRKKKILDCRKPKSTV